MRRLLLAILSLVGASVPAVAQPYTQPQCAAGVPGAEPGCTQPIPACFDCVWPAGVTELRVWLDWSSFQYAGCPLDASKTELETALRSAIGVWNSEGGAGLRLAYYGTSIPGSNASSRVVRVSATCTRGMVTDQNRNAGLCGATGMVDLQVGLHFTGLKGVDPLKPPASMPHADLVGGLVRQLGRVYGLAELGRCEADCDAGCFADSVLAAPVANDSRCVGSPNRQRHLWNYEIAALRDGGQLRHASLSCGAAGIVAGYGRYTGNQVASMTSDADGGSWTAPMEHQGASNAAPAVAFGYRTGKTLWCDAGPCPQVVMAFMGTDAAGHIHTRIGDGQGFFDFTWSTTTGGQTKHAPAIAYGNGTWLLVHTAADDRRVLFSQVSTDGYTWSAPQLVWALRNGSWFKPETHSAPAVTFDATTGRFVVAWIDRSSDQLSFVSTDTPGQYGWPDEVTDTFAPEYRAVSSLSLACHPVTGQCAVRYAETARAMRAARGSVTSSGFALVTEAAPMFTWAYVGLVSGTAAGNGPGALPFAHVRSQDQWLVGEELWKTSGEPKSWDRWLDHQQLDGGRRRNPEVGATMTWSDAASSFAIYFTEDEGDLCAGVTCDDGVPCTLDACRPTDGECVHTPQHAPCDDGIACTVDSCDPTDGCTSTAGPAACDDGNPCTLDVCGGDGCLNPHVAMPCANPAIPEEEIYAGVWNAGAVPTVVRRNETWTTAEAAYYSLSASGYQLIDLDVHVSADGSGNLYDSLYEKSFTGASYLWVTSDEGDWEQKLSELQGTGLRLIDYETWMLHGVRWRAGVWAAGSDAELVVDLTFDDFVTERDAQLAQGRRLVDIEILEVSGEPDRFSGVFHPGGGAWALWIGATWDAFASKMVELDAYQLVDVEVHGSPDAPRYTGVWHGLSTDDRLLGGQGYARVGQLNAQHQDKGRRLVDLERFEGTPVAPTAYSAKLYDLLASRSVGYSYALARDGEAVAWGAVGDARATWEATNAGQPMTPATRVHLASVSKAINGTATAIGSVDLDQPFYPWLADQLPDVGVGVDQVTLRELLTHTSGLDNLGYGNCANKETIVADIVAADVTQAPGVYLYSNTNTCIARMTIEAITGVDYVEWVNRTMLVPMGVFDMTTTPDPIPSLRAAYYNQAGGTVTQSAGAVWTIDYAPEAGPYGWYGSAHDLITWLVGIRNHTLLSPAATEALMDANAGWFDYATSAGIAKGHNGLWRTGDLRGVRSCVIRFPDGHDATLLINTQPNSGTWNVIQAFEAMLAD